MDEQIIGSLTGHLQKGRCILVLGPEFINIDRDDRPHDGSILNYLAESQFKQFTSPANYLTEDGFFFFDETNFEQSRQKEKILREAALFYRKLTVTESYAMLARIPFNAVISLSPDKLMESAYKDIGKPILYRKYTPAGFQDEDVVPGAAQPPVLYNLCGDTDDEDELLFTFDNLFRFLDKLFQNSPFDRFQLRISNARSFIFLGFTYDKWYLKLIFYLIKKMRGRQQQIEFKYAIVDIDKNSPNQKIDFFKSHFGMIFSSENEKAFIKDLYSACEKDGCLYKDQAQQEEKEEDEDAGPHRYKIMYLASSPKDDQPLRQGPEYFNKIKARLKMQFFQPLDPVFDLSIDSLRSNINDNDPELVFISCHGGQDNTLILSDEQNNSDELSLPHLVEIITLLATQHKRLECIVFSSCQSEVQAKAISEIIPYAIGMREPILEDASNLFTEGFFEGFLRKRSDLPYAFRNGIQKLKACPLDGETYEDYPVLYHKGQLLPSTLHAINLGV